MVWDGDGQWVHGGGGVGGVGWRVGMGGDAVVGSGVACVWLGCVIGGGGGGGGGGSPPPQKKNPPGKLGGGGVGGGGGGGGGSIMPGAVPLMPAL